MKNIKEANLRNVKYCHVLKNRIILSYEKHDNQSDKRITWDKEFSHDIKIINSQHGSDRKAKQFEKAKASFDKVTNLMLGAEIIKAVKKIKVIDLWPLNNSLDDDASNTIVSNIYIQLSDIRLCGTYIVKDDFKHVSYDITPCTWTNEAPIFNFK